MFHIFRWRRDPENITPSDLTTNQEHKDSHLRHHGLQFYHGKPPFERLFHVRRHRSSSDYDKRQVKEEKKPDFMSIVSWVP
ncbi:unnamed protein product [Rotaria sordida]|uniref:Uncharacterized protein n=1 Tax=Rotaria sordida TaxID=392033 RepID=A0A818IN28_9BILA|nr:unnamed protein product [Rotaria sordida]